MLNKVARVAQSKWAFRIILILWAIALVHEFVPEGGQGMERNYFDTHRTPFFVWLSLILASYGAYALKRRSLRSFGCIEVMLGAVGGYIAVSTVPLSHIEAWVEMGVAAYAIVSGAENISGES
jgi:hypothetical protein